MRCGGKMKYERNKTLGLRFKMRIKMSPPPRKDFFALTLLPRQPCHRFPALQWLDSTQTGCERLVSDLHRRHKFRTCYRSALESFPPMAFSTDHAYPFGLDATNTSRYRHRPDIEVHFVRKHSHSYSTVPFRQCHAATIPTLRAFSIPWATCYVCAVLP